MLLGACTHHTQSPKLCIVTEFVSGGSLRNFLTRNTLSWKQVENGLCWVQVEIFFFFQVLKFSIAIARGMAWLHTRKPPVLHRDLHPGNILVIFFQVEICKFFFLLSDHRTWGM